MHESDAKAQARKAFAAAQQEAGFTDFTQRETVWPVDVTCPVTGERFRGSFRSRMPSLAERDQANLVAASFAGGAPWDSIPPETQARFLMYGKFAVLLAERPDWFENPSSFMSEDVPAAVYRKLLKHSMEYFRSGLRQEGGRAADAGSDQSPAQGVG